MNRRWIGYVLLVLLVAAGLRLWSLPDLPVGLHYDEAANVVLTRQIAYSGYRPLFIRAYTGKEVLFFYIAALWLRALGGMAWGLRLCAAMLGTLTVATTYTMARQLCGNAKHAPLTALFAAAWMAILFPHVLLSHYGFRAISLPLLESLTLILIWRGLRSGRWLVLLAAGAMLGATSYTYLASRLFPIPIAVAAGVSILTAHGEHRRHLLVRWAGLLTAAVLVILPLGLFFLRNPQSFSTRITQVASSTWSDALRGLWLCLRALGWPGAGDPYIRFNLPGRAILDPLSALLALIGLMVAVVYRPLRPLDRAAKATLLTGLVCMVLPSALATSEITPSNLRLVGLYPFLVLLPALGLSTLLSRLRMTRAAPFVLALVFIAGGASSGTAYARWAASSELFLSADGEMVLAAQALDRTIRDGATVYIASEHYRHPTVAALAARYADAKWLTGGATLVLPATGDGIYLIPRSLERAWPAAVSQAWNVETLVGPAGTPALSILTLSADDIAALRPSQSAADFAHVALVHSVELPTRCYAGQPCTILIAWQPLAGYDQALQPVVRLWHPESGEWARDTRFHYPPEQWTPGEIVYDQITLSLPGAMPPGDAYRISVGFYSPESQSLLPRLREERFGGLEVQFPLEGTGYSIYAAPVEQQAADGATACAAFATQGPLEIPALALLAWSVAPAEARPGDPLAVDLCWQAGTAPEYADVRLQLEGEARYVLYEGEPAQGYSFAGWRDGEVVIDRYRRRIPRDAIPGLYRLTLMVDSLHIGDLATLEVQALDRSFNVPAVAVPSNAIFGRSLRLLGYELSALRLGTPLEVILTWQVLEELDEDYTVYLHLVDADSGEVLAQLDAQPHDGAYPTSLWVRDEVVQDAHILSVPSELAGSGRYALRLGLYLPMSGVYLTTKDGAVWTVLADSLAPAP